LLRSDCLLELGTDVLSVAAGFSFCFKYSCAFPFEELEGKIKMGAEPSVFVFAAFFRHSLSDLDSETIRGFVPKLSRRRIADTVDCHKST